MPIEVMVFGLVSSEVKLLIQKSGDVLKSIMLITFQTLGTLTNTTMMVGLIQLFKVTTLNSVDQCGGEDGLTPTSQKTLNTFGLKTGLLPRHSADGTKELVTTEPLILVSANQSRTHSLL